MILKLQRTSFRKCLGPSAYHVSGTAFQPCVILYEDAVLENCHGTGVNFFSILPNGPPKHDVIYLKLTRWPQRVYHRRINTVNRTSHSIRVSRIVIIIEHLHLNQAHEEYSAIASSLA